MALSPAMQRMVSAAANKYKSSGNGAVKPKEGRNVYRLLAPKSSEASWVVDDQFWADQGVHWIKAEENGKPLAVVGDCDTVYQRPSVINAAIDMAIGSALDEESKKLFESWKARRSVLINVIQRNPTNPANEEVVVLELTGSTFGSLLNLISVYNEADQDITDLLTGADIVLTRTGTGLNTKYELMVAPGVSRPVPKEMLARCVDLPKFIETNFFRGEEQKALNAIAQISGVAVPRLGAVAAATKTPALASPAAAVTQPAETPAPAPVAAGPTPEQLALDARRAAILKKQAEAAAAAAAELAELEALDAEPVAAAPVAPAAGASTTSTLPMSEQDAILAELDNL